MKIMQLPDDLISNPDFEIDKLNDLNTKTTVSTLIGFGAVHIPIYFEGNWEINQ